MFFSVLQHRVNRALLNYVKGGDGEKRLMKNDLARLWDEPSSATVALYHIDWAVRENKTVATSTVATFITADWCNMLGDTY